MEAISQHACVLRDEPFGNGVDFSACVQYVEPFGHGSDLLACSYCTARYVEPFGHGRDLLVCVLCVEPFGHGGDLFEPFGAWRQFLNMCTSTVSRAIYARW